MTFPEAERPAVDDVDLDVPPGEVVALLGPSGCGKTTLLRVVAGLLAPDAGALTLDGVDLAPVPTHRRGVGLMFQDYALFPHRDVAGNVEFGLRMAGQDKVDRRRQVAEVLELVGLPGWEGRRIDSLSGGERQRVALARALAPRPRLLLLDEPLGALDRSLRDRLIPELSTLFREVGASVVHVTHDQAEALALADRVVVMDGGRIAQRGRPDEVWNEPASSFVARFLGFANVVPAQWPGLGSARGGGAETEALVRPESIRLVPVEESKASEGAIPAVVTAVVFKGDHSMVTVATADGVTLDAQVATGLRRWEPGEHALLMVDTAGVQRFD